MKLFYLTWFFLILNFVNTQFVDHVSRAILATESVLNSIHSRWEIDQFPKFLKSAAMSHTSWEVLKLKFQSKFLLAFQGKTTSFVIGFMGSSVTAGHDSPFNLSFPILTGNLMKPAFSPFSITLETRNSAMGNNPCLPYDLCPRTFAGLDADIVHWEQSFNCFGSDPSKRVVFEQFVRQSLSLPNQPIVVLSTSDTPNWKESDCDGKDTSPVGLSEEEKALMTLLRTDPIKIPSEANKDEIQKRWPELVDLLKSYKVAGIQMWSHVDYEPYKCRGPYVKNWGCCSASWHPSLLGHELRAAHYSYFWLLIYLDALRELKSEISSHSVEILLNRIQKRIDSEHKYIPTNQMYPSTYSDNLRCLTTFEPRFDLDADLSKYIVHPKTGPKFSKAIFEEFIAKDVLTTARKQGYKDFKYMFYGNQQSQYLSVKLQVNQLGSVWVCQPPGNWGALPTGFKNFWEVGTKFYLNINCNSTNFEFNPENSHEIRYVNHFPKDTQNICVEIVEPINPGDHILTIVPTTLDKIMISYVIIP